MDRIVARTRRLNPVVALLAGVIAFGPTGIDCAAPDTDANTSGVAVPEPPGVETERAGDAGRRVAEYADRRDRGWTDEVIEGEMTLFDARGDSVRRRFMRLVYERATAGDKIITKFLAPAGIKGVTALTHENPGGSDSNWLYLPATKRVRRIAAATRTARFQGTEFTYEDLGRLDPTEYEWRLLGPAASGDDGREVYRLEAVPTYSGTGYSRLVVSIDRETWRHERVEYFDRAGKRLKTKSSSNWELFHGRFWRAGLVEMKNHQTGRRTVLEIQRHWLLLRLYRSASGEPRPGLPEDLFTTRAIRG